MARDWTRAGFPVGLGIVMLVACGGDPPPIPNDAGAYCGNVYPLSVDPNNCGACGNVCDAGMRCVEGACETPPPTPFYHPCETATHCTSYCYTFSTDTFAVCLPRCDTPDGCPASDLGGAATPVCEPALGQGTGYCVLGCTRQDQCPHGRVCRFFQAALDAGVLHQGVCLL